MSCTIELANERNVESVDDRVDVDDAVAFANSGSDLIAFRLSSVSETWIHVPRIGSGGTASQESYFPWILLSAAMLSSGIKLSQPVEDDRKNVVADPVSDGDEVQVTD